jgi:hypothetical protein
LENFAFFGKFCFFVTSTDILSIGYKNRNYMTARLGTKSVSAAHDGALN